MSEGGVSFSEVVARAEGISPRAAELGNWFAEWIPPPRADGTGLSEAALWWAHNVGKIVPLWPGNHERAKEARSDVLGHGWTVDAVASRDLDVVRGWWSDEPFSNIGFATRSNRILIVDLDPRHGGLERWRTLCRREGIEDSEVPRSVSPRGDGGQHLWYRIPDSWKGADGILYPHSSLMPGVDRPWQVPVPPSLRVVDVDAEARDPDRRRGLRPYTWLAGDPRALPDAPEVLLGDQLEATQGLAGGGSGSRVDDLASEPMDIVGLSQEGVPVGEQSYTFKRMACSMVARGWDDETIVRALLVTAQRSPVGDPDHPWGIADLVPMVTHARRYIERSRASELLESQRYAQNLTRRY